jgi:hypothetical protein
MTAKTIKKEQPATIPDNDQTAENTTPAPNDSEITGNTTITPDNDIPAAKADNIEPLQIPQYTEAANSSAKDNTAQASGQYNAEIDDMASRFVLIMAFEMIGEFAYSMTGVEAVKMNDRDPDPNSTDKRKTSEKLADIWKGYIPQMSPMTAAILSSVLIVSPKVTAVIAAKRNKKSNKDAEIASLDTDSEKAAE